MTRKNSLKEEIVLKRLAASMHETSAESNEMMKNEKGIYVGNWKANKMQGFGIFRWASGRVYAGHWLSDVKNGVGILSFKGGNEIVGEFQGDKREGYGYYKWADNRRFKGWWHQNK
jgi:hypothetical protein